MPPSKRTLKPMERFDPHPPGTTHEMGANRVMKSREKKADRERKREKRGGGDDKETPQLVEEEAIEKQLIDKNNNEKSGTSEVVQDTIPPLKPSE